MRCATPRHSAQSIWFRITVSRFSCMSMHVNAIAMIVQRTGQRRSRASANALKSPEHSTGTVACRRHRPQPATVVCIRHRHVASPTSLGAAHLLWACVARSEVSHPLLTHAPNKHTHYCCRSENVYCQFAFSHMSLRCGERSSCHVRRLWNVRLCGWHFHRKPALMKIGFATQKNAVGCLGERASNERACTLAKCEAVCSVWPFRLALRCKLTLLRVHNSDGESRMECTCTTNQYQLVDTLAAAAAAMTTICNMSVITHTHTCCHHAVIDVGRSGRTAVWQSTFRKVLSNKCKLICKM